MSDQLDPSTTTDEPQPGGSTAPQADGRDTVPVRRLTLSELADLAGMTSRNVRAYQQRGLLDPPIRLGRKAYYTWDHLTRLRIVTALHDHGLTLRVISDLLERGAADSELVRLGREDVSATWSQSVRVPMADVIVDWFKTNMPDGLENLAQVGLVERQADQYFANAAGLGIAAGLTRRDLTPDVSTRVAISAAGAAQDTVKALQVECKELSRRRTVTDRREVTLLLMQLAATAFADIVHNAVLECLADLPAEVS